MYIVYFHIYTHVVLISTGKPITVILHILCLAFQYPQWRGIPFITLNVLLAPQAFACCLVIISSFQKQELVRIKSEKSCVTKLYQVGASFDKTVKLCIYKCARLLNSILEFHNVVQCYTMLYILRTKPNMCKC